MATGQQILDSDLANIRIVTKKNGEFRCESTKVYDRSTKVVDGRTWITLSTPEGDPTIVVDDLNQELGENEDPAGNYTHQIFIKAVAQSFWEDYDIQESWNDE